MSILLSEKHGVNPALLVCAICGADAGVALMGRLKGDVEAPKRINDGRTLCTSCDGVMKQGGGLLIEVKDNTGGWSRDPERTGQVWGLKKAAFDGLGLEPEQRVAYVTESDAKKMGLPKAAA